MIAKSGWPHGVRSDTAVPIAATNGPERAVRIRPEAAYDPSVDRYETLRVLEALDAEARSPRGLVAACSTRARILTSVQERGDSRHRAAMRGRRAARRGPLAALASDSGKTVLSRAQVNELGAALTAIHAFFNPVYGPNTPDHFYGMDVEFKFDTTEDGSVGLFVKQARPYPGRGG
jgi:hypothetical protein